MRGFGFNRLRRYATWGLIDPHMIDARGRTNIERMKDGAAPIGPDGKSMELHHMIQTEDSPIAEMTRTFHNAHYDVVHVYPRSGKGAKDYVSGINRPSFDNWRASYWRSRRYDFMSIP